MGPTSSFGSDILRRNPLVAMVQAAADRECNQFARAFKRLGPLAGNGRVAVQSLMGSSNVIVLGDGFLEQPIQTALAQHDDVIQQLPSQRAYESLDVRILPRTSIGRHDFLDAASDEERADAVAVDAVIVAEHVPG